MYSRSSTWSWLFKKQTKQNKKRGWEGSVIFNCNRSLSKSTAQLPEQLYQQDKAGAQEQGQTFQSYTFFLALGSLLQEMLIKVHPSPSQTHPAQADTLLCSLWYSRAVLSVSHGADSAGRPLLHPPPERHTSMGGLQLCFCLFLFNSTHTQTHLCLEKYTLQKHAWHVGEKVGGPW